MLRHNCRFQSEETGVKALHNEFCCLFSRLLGYDVGHRHGIMTWGHSGDSHMKAKGSLMPSKSPGHEGTGYVCIDSSSIVSPIYYLDRRA